MTNRQHESQDQLAHPGGYSPPDRNTTAPDLRTNIAFPCGLTRNSADIEDRLTALHVRNELERSSWRPRSARGNDSRPRRVVRESVLGPTPSRHRIGQQYDGELIEVDVVVAGELATGVVAADTGSDVTVAASAGSVAFSTVPGCSSPQDEPALPAESVLTASSSPSPLVTFSVKPSPKNPPSLVAAEEAKYSLRGLPEVLLVW
jgi:hypothetical protein